MRIKSQHHSIAFALLVAVACGVACGGDDGASPMAASELCEAYADEYCSGVDECCSELVFMDRSACRSDRLSYCITELLTVDDRGMAPFGPNIPARIVFDFDEEGAGEAIARMTSAFNRCEGDARVTFADTHYLGEPGSECLQHADCVEGTRCEHPPLAVFGTCVLAPLEGQECTDVCSSHDQLCTYDEDNGDSICVARRSEGQSCDELECVAGLVCSEQQSTIVGISESVCVKLGGTGDSCVYDTECASYYCLGGSCAESASERELFCQAVLQFGPPINGLQTLAP